MKLKITVPVRFEFDTNEADEVLDKHGRPQPPTDLRPAAVLAWAVDQVFVAQAGADVDNPHGFSRAVFAWDKAVAEPEPEPEPARPGSQIVVTFNDPMYDPFMGTLAYAKAAMVTAYAPEFGAEVTTEYRQSFTYCVAVVPHAGELGFVAKLASRGCADVHVYTADPVTAELIESAHRGLFRVVRHEFKP